MSLSSRPPRLYRQCWPVVWLAGRLVPAHQRSDWYGRWRHEIWHWAAFLEESGRLTPRSQYELVRHCWHAFSDALWTRFNRERTLQRTRNTVHAPWFAVAVAAIALVVLAIVSSGFERTRMLALPLPVPSPSRVGNVEYVGSWWSALVTAVPADWVRTWRQHSQSVTGAAEFTLEQRMVRGVRLSTEAGIARVAPNFFDVTGGTAAAGRLFHASDRICTACVVVSYRFWQSEMHGDPRAVGQTLDLDGDLVTVVGVAPHRFWMPAGGVSIWRPVFFTNVGDLWPVGVVVRVKDNYWLPDANREMEETVRRYGLNNPTGRAWPGGAIEILPFQSQSRQLLLLYAVLLVVALLAAMVMGVWRYHPNRAAISLRWLSYLFGKTLLLLLACALAAIELTPQLAYAAGRVFDTSVTALSLFLCLAMSVAALLWSLHDQRQRCPICLTRLELPVQVGEPSHMLFGFGATEFVCSRGHGLLHISDSHCSWIDPEEWTGLDASWQNLFNDISSGEEGAEREEGSE